MAGPNFPLIREITPGAPVPQQDNRKDWGKGTEIDPGGVSQTHKGYGRRGKGTPQPQGYQTHTVFGESDTPEPWL